MKYQRLTYILLFLALVIAMLIGFYLQYGLQIKPCLLCYIQRIFLYLLIITTMLAAIFYRGLLTKYLFSGITIIFSLFGLIAAGRQIWLQHQPPTVNLTCLPDPTVLLKTFPLFDVIRISFQGTADCAQIDGRFMGMTLSEWSAVFFIAVIAVSLFQLFKEDFFVEKQGNMDMDVR